jgi:hypothetical protein
MIFCRERIIVWVMVTAAIRDNTKLRGQNLQLRFPGAVITLTSVQKNERLTLSLLDVVQLYIVNTNLCWLNALTNGRSAKQ